MIQRRKNSVVGLEPTYLRSNKEPSFKGDGCFDQFNQRLSSLKQYSPISLVMRIANEEALGSNVQNGHADAIDKKILASQASKALIKEVDTTAQFINGRCNVTSLHFQFTQPEIEVDIAGVAAGVEAVENAFGLTDSVPISIDLDPRVLSLSDAALFGALGIKHVRLGMGTFGQDSADIRSVSYRHVERLMAAFRKSGVSDIDIIFDNEVSGLNRTQFLKNLTLVAVLDPECVAFDWGWPPRDVATEEEMAEVPGGLNVDNLNLARIVLSTGGYKPVGYEHFFLDRSAFMRRSSSARLKRSLIGITANPSDILIGFGPGAVSQFKDLLIQNEGDPARYRTQISRSENPQKLGMHLSPEYCARSKIIEDLMSSFSTDVLGYCHIYGIDFDLFSGCLDHLDALKRDGAFTYHEGQLTITDRGRLLAPFIASCFGYDSKQAKARP